MSIDHWTLWKSWDPTTAMWPPPDVQPGALTEADLVVRANFIGVPFKDGEPRPAFTRHVFIVTTGEAWVLNPAWTDVQTSHLVTRYRVWGGTAEDYKAWITDRLNDDADQEIEA